MKNIYKVRILATGGRTYGDVYTIEADYFNIYDGSVVFYKNGGTILNISPVNYTIIQKVTENNS